jgi:hypothetical protein
MNGVWVAIPAVLLGDSALRRVARVAACCLCWPPSMYIFATGLSVDNESLLFSFLTRRLPNRTYRIVEACDKAKTEHIEQVRGRCCFHCNAPKGIAGPLRQTFWRI